MKQSIKFSDIPIGEHIQSASMLATDCTYVKVSSRTIRTLGVSKDSAAATSWPSAWQEFYIVTEHLSQFIKHGLGKVD